MSSSFFDTLTLEQQIRLDRLCDGFEQAWAAGQQPSIDRFLEEFPSEHRPTALPGIRPARGALRRKRSEHPTLAEYQLRFPDHGEALAALSCFSAAREWPARPGETDDNEVLQTTPIDEPAVKPGESPLETSGLPLRPGSMIGSYRVLDKLGQGGMGEVYRVAHQLIDCQRALKTLRPQLASQPEAVRRFLQEAQVSVRHLTHPNLVTVYDVSRDGDTVYLVMELVDGVDLHRLVEREGPLAPARARKSCGKRPRPAIRARTWLRAPRHQAPQHHADASWRGENPRSGTGASAGSAGSGTAGSNYRVRARRRTFNTR